jgi:hypothetical protein
MILQEVEDRDIGQARCIPLEELADVLDPTCNDAETKQRC